MDVARLMIQTGRGVLINEVTNMVVDGVLFKIKLVEEAQGPVVTCCSKKSAATYEDSDGWYEDSLPEVSGGALYGLQQRFRDTFTNGG